jgi:hypothetical protein
MYSAVEKFLSKHLEGRYQDSMTPEVAKRLPEITVDPKTVTLTKAVDTAAVKVPAASQPLVAGSSSYNASIALGGQTMKMETMTTVAEQGDAWLVTETAKTPQGDVSDVSLLDKKTLAVRTREIKQGPVNIKLSFEGGKASGNFSMGGQEKPIAVDLGGTLFGDGAGAFPSIAALPLKEGYSTTFRNFDVMKQKPALKQAKVTAVEEVTVPAGTFKAWKVEIASAEGEPGQQTVWIDTASRRVLKTSATLPQMGGAVATAELVK